MPIILTYNNLKKSNNIIISEMGIYNSGSIFGIRIYNFNEDGFENILFGKTYNEIMNDEEKKKAYLFYNELNNKDELRFKYYTQCSSTYGKGTFLMWYPISLNIFLEKFNI
jgi:hypothetical protein